MDGDKVFVCGLVSVVSGSLTLKPDFVASCKDDVARKIFSYVSLPLIFATAFASALGFCWAKIKQIQNENEEKVKFVAVGNMKCVVCVGKIIEVVVSPCNHLCLCFECSVKVDECPICGQKKEGFQRVYHG